MNKQKKPVTKSDKLRQAAELVLTKKKQDAEVSATESDTSKLIHELEVHQIELEMQNEELKQAKEKAELAEKKYTELYDFAPSGYLTLTKEGEIIDLNFSAERLLGKERSHLIKSQRKSGRSRQAEISFPGQHEPRNPHANEWNTGFYRTA